MPLQNLSIKPIEQVSDTVPLEWLCMYGAEDSDTHPHKYVVSLQADTLFPCADFMSSELLASFVKAQPEVPSAYADSMCYPEKQCQRFTAIDILESPGQLRVRKSSRHSRLRVAARTIHEVVHRRQDDVDCQEC